MTYKLAKGHQISFATAIKVDTQTVEDSRMQNMALLGIVAKHRLIPGVSKENYEAALEDLLAGEVLKKNTAIFNAYASKRVTSKGH